MNGNNWIRRFTSYSALPHPEGAAIAGGKQAPLHTNYESRPAPYGNKKTPRDFEPLLSVVAGLEQPHIGGAGDNILVSFAYPAPLGWVLWLTCNNPTIQLPRTYAVPQGAYNVFVPFISEAVKEDVDVMISVSLGGQTLSSSFRVFPIDTEDQLH